MPAPMGADMRESAARAVTAASQPPEPPEAARTVVPPRPGHYTGRHLTEDELRLLVDSVRRGDTTAEIAAVLSLASQSVNLWRRRLEGRASLPQGGLRRIPEDLRPLFRDTLVTLPPSATALPAPKPKPAPTSLYYVVRGATVTAHPSAAAAAAEVAALPGTVAHDQVLVIKGTRLDWQETRSVRLIEPREERP